MTVSASARKFTARNVEDYEYLVGGGMHIWAEEIGDDYHTLHELYQHRMALTIALFGMWHKYSPNIEVMKAKLHHDGTMFDGGYFIVMAITPFGQISYHYKLKYWDHFHIPEVERTPPYDGHSATEVLTRLEQAV